MTKPPFMEITKRMTLAERLAERPGVIFPDDAMTRRPSIGLDVLIKPDSLRQFLDAFDWVISEVKALEE